MTMAATGTAHDLGRRQHQLPCRRPAAPGGRRRADAAAYQHATDGNGNVDANPHPTPTSRDLDGDADANADRFGFAYADRNLDGDAHANIDGDAKSHCYRHAHSDANRAATLPTADPAALAALAGLLRGRAAGSPVPLLRFGTYLDKGGRPMPKQRVTLAILLIVALLAPGVILAQPAAPQAGDSNSPPSQAEAPKDFPWQANKSVYAYLPDCTDQGSPDIAIDAAQNLYVVWNNSRGGSPDVYFAYRPSVGAWSANVRVNDVPGTAAGQRSPSMRPATPTSPGLTAATAIRTSTSPTARPAAPGAPIDE